MPATSRCDQALANVLAEVCAARSRRACFWWLEYTNAPVPVAATTTPATTEAMMMRLLMAPSNPTDLSVKHLAPASPAGDSSVAESRHEEHNASDAPAHIADPHVRRSGACRPGGRHLDRAGGSADVIC